MEQGFQLAPSDDERIISARSPTVSPPVPSSIVKERRNNDSQESLFYSSSTCKEDTHRSPRFINLPILESEKPKIKVQGERSLKERISDKIGRTHTQIENKPKFDKKNERIKELEEALDAETLVTEELRGRMNVMTELVEKGFRQGQLAQFLKCRNSSKSLTHVDIFIQLEILREQTRKLKTQLSTLERQNYSLKQSMSELESQLTNKQYLLKEQGILLEENESLSAYVEEFERKYNALNEENLQNIAHIKMLEQNVGTQSSTKNCLEECLRAARNQIDNLNASKQRLIQQYELKVESSREEYISILLTKDEQITQLKESLQEAKKKLGLALEIGPKKEDYDRIRWELQNCRKERQYYHQEYLNKLSQSAQLHEVKLKHKAEVEYLKEKIGRREKEYRPHLIIS